MEHYGLKWTELRGRNTYIHRQKYFTSVEKRQAYAAKLVERNSFIEFVAWVDPKVTLH